MMKLKIINLSKKAIAIITHSDDELLMDILVTEYKNDLEKFFQKIKSEPVKQRTGRKTTVEGEELFVTEVKELTCEDKEFLLAVKDLLPHININGEHVMGLIKRD